MILFGLSKETTILSVKQFCKFVSPNISMTSGGILYGRVTRRSAPKIVPLKTRNFQIWTQKLVNMSKGGCSTRDKKRREARVQTKFKREMLLKVSSMLIQRLTETM